nr:hypothetical protein [Endozoicomonas sp. SESOKO3]
MVVVNALYSTCRIREGVQNPSWIQHVIYPDTPPSPKGESGAVVIEVNARDRPWRIPQSILWAVQVLYVINLNTVSSVPIVTSPSCQQRAVVVEFSAHTIKPRDHSLRGNGQIPRVINPDLFTVPPHCQLGTVVIVVKAQYPIICIGQNCRANGQIPRVINPDLIISTNCQLSTSVIVFNAVYRAFRIGQGGKGSGRVHWVINPDLFIIPPDCQLGTVVVEGNSLHPVFSIVQGMQESGPRRVTHIKDLYGA